MTERVLTDSNGRKYITTEPFKPDWVSYRQGKLDGAAESLEETKREWVGLTPADYDAMRPRVPYIVNDFSFCDVAAIIEAKLKELNHG